MSRIELVTFLTYPGNENKVRAKEVFPAPRSVIKHGSGEAVVLGDVPFPAGVPQPKQGMTVLYGYQDTAVELADQHAKAREKGDAFVKVVCKLEIGETINGVIGPEQVKDIQFLNLKRRASRSLQEIIVNGVNMIAAKANKDPVLFDKCSQVGSRPDLLCQFLRTDPMFQHIKGVTYDIPDGNRTRQVATIFSNDVTDVVEYGECPFSLAFPAIGDDAARVILDREEVAEA